MHDQGEDQDEVMKKLVSIHQAEQEKAAKMLTDKVMIDLKDNIVVLDDFKRFPKVSMHLNGGIVYEHYFKHNSIRDVNDSRLNYYKLRLAQAEERIFSHPNIYERAKLTDNSSPESGVKVVSSMNSILGATDKKWVLGLLS